MIILTHHPSFILDELQTVVLNIKEVKKKLLPESLVREVVRRDLLESLVRDRDGCTTSYNEAVLRWLNLFSDDAEINEAEVTGNHYVLLNGKYKVQNFRRCLRYQRLIFNILS